MNNRFSGPVIVFHGFSLPEKGTPVGYAALIDAYNLPCPFPTIKMAIGTKHTIVKENDWHLLTPRYQPENSVKGHLAFALKYEGVDLCVLKKLFELLDPNEICKMVQASITGAYSRRIWFLYEWLMGKALDLPDVQRGNYVHALDPLKQLAVTGKRSMRHRVVNNLPGTPDFCPLIRRTEELDAYISMNLKEKALLISTNIPKDVVARAAAFLLLKDSQASFAIENEAPPHDRIMRWGNAIRDAGKSPISKDALVQLQKMVIGDSRFVKPGYRETGGFVGEHDRDTGMPVVEHFSAKHEDIDSLIDGLVAYSKKITHTIAAVCAAAAIAFGFVYIHPFVDGNGRIHRYLIHHILAENGYNPPGMIFPVSSSMLNRIAEYEVVLRGYSQTILPFIKWETTKDHNVRVLNDTVDYYRYFDATAHAVFLYQCVKETIEHEIPEEAHFLVRYDTFRKTVQDGIEIPDTTVFLLYNFLSQNGGKLSKRAQEKEFHALSQTQIERFEQLYERLFIE
ncbi:MAG: Fic family protein [Sphaerochaeta associata]|uniref:Fic family protein n=1 Tax=Sphaerochaeta associata TaxID=1129264 RepID=UPI002B1F7051|nr:Fic family protein [Sphaerochaeta associata]MEA5028028.1 Fic family protein [Sphaerochaeta associata]